MFWSTTCGEFLTRGAWIGYLETLIPS